MKVLLARAFVHAEHVVMAGAMISVAIVGHPPIAVIGLVLATLARAAVMAARAPRGDRRVQFRVIDAIAMAATMLAMVWQGIGHAHGLTAESSELAVSDRCLLVVLAVVSWIFGRLLLARRPDGDAGWRAMEPVSASAVLIGAATMAISCL
ncbi:hypothetical protein LXM50_09545 [Microbacterium sp. Au-Mic1]|uniref:hypothetical protein n=1 Tax=Microbacterium sp. Au-Mic1 TaxID=2906457 RepID=UPI001E52F325|nr:hypothetical protein [Microbacterium sp. Au-Mic1]MCE4026218.1 hypothetical protein [Microbacterium sp. Au-Mic1]